MRITSEEELETLIPSAKGRRAKGIRTDLVFEIPTDSGRKNALGWVLCDATGSGTKGIAVTERGIWNSSENSLAFDALVRCSSENGIEYDDPQMNSILFSKDESEMLAAVVRLCLTNIWGFRLFVEERGVCLEVDHHETMIVFIRNQKDSKSWVRLASNMDLRQANHAAGGQGEPSPA